MSRQRSFLCYWLPVLIWMGLIFSASSDTRSSQHSSRIIGPIVRWLAPGISAPRVAQIVFLVRKMAHVTEYAILSALLGRALMKPGAPGEGVNWNRGKAFVAWLASAAYAATDEVHQAFVPNREGQWGDVLLDSLGAGVGILLLYLMARWRNRRRAENTLKFAD